MFKHRDWGSSLVYFIAPLSAMLLVVVVVVVSCGCLSSVQLFLYSFLTITGQRVKGNTKAERL
jgi:nucleoside recognition membrane protein YjiH